LCVNCGQTGGFNIKKFSIPSSERLPISFDSGVYGRERQSSWLSRTFLTIFLRVIEPMLQNNEFLRFDFEEGKASAEIGLHIDDFCFGVKRVFTGKNLHEDHGFLREGIHHIEIAAMEAQFANASSDADIGFLLDEFGAGDEGVAGRAALFSFQEGGPLK